jgi:hypothetical protein
VQVHCLVKNQKLCTRLVIVEKTLTYPSTVRANGPARAGRREGGMYSTLHFRGMQRLPPQRAPAH